MKMRTVYVVTLLSVMFSMCVYAGDPIRVIVFGAHPDDCDLSAGGTAVLFAQMGHKVKFVSLTNGDKGHHEMSPEALAERRVKEMEEAAKCLGVVYEHLDNHDGELQPTIENRKAVIRKICDWKADIVITHRPYDYHPDHRYTSILVQDAAYMISVPLMVSGGEPLLDSPVFLYLQDSFRKPQPFSPDIFVDITPVTDKKVDAICAHVSQIFEWLPWNSGYTGSIPTDKKGRREMAEKYFLRQIMDKTLVEAASAWYSPDQIRKISYYEAFEICEYGRIPDVGEIRRLFPMLP